MQVVWQASGSQDGTDVFNDSEHVRKLEHEAGVCGVFWSQDMASNEETKCWVLGIACDHPLEGRVLQQSKQRGLLA